jgi:hypothetical protein
MIGCGFTRGRRGAYRTRPAIKPDDRPTRGQPRLSHIDVLSFERVGSSQALVEELGIVRAGTCEFGRSEQGRRRGVA